MNLPHDIIRVISGFMGIYDYLRLTGCCRSLYTAHRENRLQVINRLARLPSSLLDTEIGRYIESLPNLYCCQQSISKSIARISRNGIDTSPQTTIFLHYYYSDMDTVKSLQTFLLSLGFKPLQRAFCTVMLQGHVGGVGIGIRLMNVQDIWNFLIRERTNIGTRMRLILRDEYISPIYLELATNSLRSIFDPPLKKYLASLGC